MFDTGPDGFAQMTAGTLGGVRPLYVTPTFYVSMERMAEYWRGRRRALPAIGR